jgi:hypothetical protein
MWRKESKEELLARLVTAMIKNPNSAFLLLYYFNVWFDVGTELAFVKLSHDGTLLRDCSRRGCKPSAGLKTNFSTITENSCFL